MLKNSKAMMTEKDTPPCNIYIDKEGRWFHKGAEMTHREFIRLFYQHMTLDSLGRYVIRLGGDCCYVEVEDAPFVVRRVISGNSDQRNRSRFILYLSDDSQEDLCPDTLYVGHDNVLYCKVKNRTFPARFDRPAYYQLTEYIEEENGKYFLPMKGEKYIIRRKDE